MAEQRMLFPDKDYLSLDQFFMEYAGKKVLLVCGQSIASQRIGKYFETLGNRVGIQVVKFQDFTPNPSYESVEQGVRCYRENGCGMLVAVGGGSAIDVAKCIKVFSPMDSEGDFLGREISSSFIPFLAIPTTAGTGSEATRYAVIYFQGEKRSVTHETCIPSAVMLDAALLKSLPLYQRKATYMDAFCHALESFWSVNSSEESKGYARDAIGLIMEYGMGYLENQNVANEKMLLASHLAGKAINITQTTAGHALSYKLTSLYGIAHGHAAALCVSKVWRYMTNHLEDCIDIRGKEYLGLVFDEIANAMKCKNIENAIAYFDGIVKKLGLELGRKEREINWEDMIYSVNVERLRNNPVHLPERAISEIYHQIIG